MEWKIIPQTCTCGHTQLDLLLSAAAFSSQQREEEHGRREGTEKQGREPNWREMEGRQKNKNMSLEAHTEYSRADFDVCTHTQNAKSQKFGSRVKYKKNIRFA